MGEGCFWEALGLGARLMVEIFTDKCQSLVDLLQTVDDCIQEKDDLFAFFRRKSFETAENIFLR